MKKIKSLYILSLTAIVFLNACGGDKTEDDLAHEVFQCFLDDNARAFKQLYVNQMDIEDNAKNIASYWNSLVSVNDHIDEIFTGQNISIAISADQFQMGDAVDLQNPAGLPNPVIPEIDILYEICIGWCESL